MRKNLNLFRNNFFTFFKIIFLLTIFYSNSKRPFLGPMPWPLWGNTLTLRRYSPGYKAFQKWSNEFGPIFTYWIGEAPIVAITDFELIKETFLKDGETYAGRDYLNAGFLHLKGLPFR